MARWFRWHEGTCEDGKFRVVARNAKVTVATVMGLWAIILEDASHVEHRGIATRGSEYYGAILDLDSAEVDIIISKMDEAKLVAYEISQVVVLKWKERQFETDTKDGTNAKRQADWRERNKKNGSKGNRNGGVTAAKRPDTDTDTDNKTPALRALSWPEGFLDFYEAYPKKIGKKDAAKAYAQACREVSRETILASLRKIIPTWGDPKYIPHPATWLRRGGFYDEATVAGGSVERHSFNDPLAGIQ